MEVMVGLEDFVGLESISSSIKRKLYHWLRPHFQTLGCAGLHVNYGLCSPRILLFSLLSGLAVWSSWFEGIHHCRNWLIPS